MRDEFATFMGSIGLTDHEAEALENDTCSTEWMQVRAQMQIAASWQHRAEHEHGRAESWKAKAWRVRGLCVALGLLCVLQQLILWGRG